jgi:hypothetical protein
MLMGELHSVLRRRRIERGAELVELFGIADRRNQKGRDLSKGLRSATPKSCSSICWRAETGSATMSQPATRAVMN